MDSMFSRGQDFKGELAPLEGVVQYECSPKELYIAQMHNQGNWDATWQNVDQIIGHYVMHKCALLDQITIIVDVEDIVGEGKTVTVNIQYRPVLEFPRYWQNAVSGDKWMLN